MTGYGRQSVTKDDIRAVVHALKSEYLTTGPKVAEFEEEFAGYVGSKYAVAVANGTAALHLAAVAAGLKKGDEVVTSPMTFCATANSVLYCGATPVFADVTSDGLLDPCEVHKKIGGKTRAIIAVDYAGEPCDIEALHKIAVERGLLLLRDSCHALGSERNGKKTGSCRYSRMTIFSFHPVKHITTGEGGMITTNSRKCRDLLRILRHHGIDSSKKPPEEPWLSNMVTLGYNYRLTDFQCALGIAQLRKINRFIRIRSEIAARYDRAFLGHPEIIPSAKKKGIRHSYHLYVLKLRNPGKRLRLYKYLADRNIFCQVHYLPVYRHGYYQGLGYTKGQCPVAEELYSRVLSIPIFVDLAQSEQKRIIRCVEEFFKHDKTD